MYRKGGFGLFFIGTSATISRDITFGGIFSLTRHELVPPNHQHNRLEVFGVDLLSGTFATILSSPMNYVRNIHYATPPDVKADTFWNILFNLWHESTQQESLTAQLRYLQRRLRLGWGTGRVGCGMAFGSVVYNYFTEQQDVLLNL